MSAELDQVKAELQTVRGLLESVMDRLDRAAVEDPPPVNLYAVGRELSMEEINREIGRGNRRPLHEQNKRRLAALRKIKLRSDS